MKLHSYFSLFQSIIKSLSSIFKHLQSYFN